MSTRVEIFVPSPHGQHFDDEEEKGSGDVVLDGEDFATVSVAEDSPSDREERVDEEESFVELEFQKHE